MRFPAINPAANKSVRTQVFWRSRYVPGLAVMGAIASYFLLTWHLAHTLGALPYLLLAACPLMHLFMHHGHGGYGSMPQAGKDIAAGASPPSQSTP